MNHQVWIVDDDDTIRWVLEKAMQQAKLSYRSFASGEAALQACNTSVPSLVISDIRMPNMDGLTLLKALQERLPNVPVIIMTAHSDLDSAVSAYQGGAFDYLPKPFDIEDTIVLIKRALASTKEQTVPHIPEPVQETWADTPHIIGEAPAMQEVFRAIGRLSQSSMTAIIVGASGTGKELIAQALHQHSPRHDRPFIALNMAAIQKNLIESELFGHEKGAYTGATQQRKGHFELAHGGTLFLDEIGDMPAEAQTRLLRVLADGAFYRVGGHTVVKVDVRIIAATHQDLQERVEQGLFREDLFHRLHVIRIAVPSLCERTEDIPALAKFFFKKTAQELNIPTKHLSAEATHFLQPLPWPGNIRQLENLCRWLSIMGTNREILISDLPNYLHPTELPTQQNSWQHLLKVWANKQLQEGNKDILKQAIPDFEDTLINIALTHTKGRKREAAGLLGWGRNTLTRKLKN